MTYDCMTPVELELWIRGAEAFVRTNGRGPKAPCNDCPAAFRDAERVAGRCSRPSPERREQMRAATRRYRTRKARTERTRQWKARLRADVEAVRRARSKYQDKAA